MPAGTKTASVNLPFLLSSKVRSRIWGQSAILDSMSGAWKSKLAKGPRPHRRRSTEICKAHCSAGGTGAQRNFREFLLKKVDATAIRRNGNYQSTQMGRDNPQLEAKALVRQG